MKPTLYGKMDLIFSRELEHSDKEMAFLENSYLLDNLAVLKIEVIVTNIYGQRTILKIDEWNNTLLDVYDEYGMQV